MKQQLIDEFNISVNDERYTLTEDTLDKGLALLDLLESFKLDELNYYIYYDNSISFDIYHNNKTIFLATDNSYLYCSNYDVGDGYWETQEEGTYELSDIPELIGKLNEVN